MDSSNEFIGIDTRNEIEHERFTITAGILKEAMGHERATIEAQRMDHYITQLASRQHRGSFLN